MENSQKQLQGQVLTMLAALPDRTQYRPTTDEMDCSSRSLAHSSFQGQRCTVSRLLSNGWWSVSWERCWSLVNLCLLTFQRWDRDLGIPRRSWLTGGNPPCVWARATSQRSIWSEPMKELCAREANDESPSTAGQKKTSCRNTTEIKVDDSHWTSLCSWRHRCV